MPPTPTLHSLNEKLLKLKSQSICIDLNFGFYYFGMMNITRHTHTHTKQCHANYIIIEKKSMSFFSIKFGTNSFVELIGNSFFFFCFLFSDHEVNFTCNERRKKTTTTSCSSTSNHLLQTIRFNSVHNFDWRHFRIYLKRVPKTTVIISRLEAILPKREKKNNFNCSNPFVKFQPFITYISHFDVWTTCVTI